MKTKYFKTWQTIRVNSLILAKEVCKSNINIVGSGRYRNFLERHQEAKGLCMKSMLFYGLKKVVNFSLYIILMHKYYQCLWLSVERFQGKSR